MKEKLKKAILNNNDLYEAVFNLQNIKFNRNDAIWYCLEKTPPLYSNLVTVSEDWKPDEIFEKIDDNFKNENWDKWSIKDSFKTLDLSKFGFKKLFDASWFYLEAAQFTPITSIIKLRYKIVSSNRFLADWRNAWDSDEPLGKKIFHTDLLNNPKVFFIAGYKEKRIVSGCIVNKTADILGISNFFAPQLNIKYWSEMINFIFDSIKFADIVGYERKDLIEKLQPLGFESIGDLTVWLRSPESAGQ